MKQFDKSFKQTSYVPKMDQTLVTAWAGKQQVLAAIVILAVIYTTAHITGLFLG